MTIFIVQSRLPGQGAHAFAPRCGKQKPRVAQEPTEIDKSSFMAIVTLEMYIDKMTI